MDTIIRYYWISWDNADGTDGEKIMRDRAAALRFFDHLNVPYKKLVACYNDHDDTIMVHHRIF